MIQYLPFSLMTSTPLIVALSLPLPAGTKVRSVRRHGRSLVTATCPSPSPLPLPAITSPWSAENAIQHNWMGFHPSKSCEMLRSPSGRSRADTFSPSAFPSSTCGHCHRSERRARTCHNALAYQSAPVMPFTSIGDEHEHPYRGCYVYAMVLRNNCHASATLPCRTTPITTSEAEGGRGCLTCSLLCCCC
jgi:hypothetical protein